MAPPEDGPVVAVPVATLNEITVENENLKRDLEWARMPGTAQLAYRLELRWKRWKERRRRAASSRTEER